MLTGPWPVKPPHMLAAGDDDERKRLERPEAEVAAMRYQVRTLEAKVMQLTDENTRLRLGRS